MHKKKFHSKKAKPNNFVKLAQVAGIEVQVIPGMLCNGIYPKGMFRMQCFLARPVQKRSAWLAVTKVLN